MSKKFKITATFFSFSTDQSRAAFWGHSRSLEPTQHMSIGYLWLPIGDHGNHGPISYRFCDKKRWLQ